jgi:aminocarboxymuconate-semialdehyde decarboxylase
MFIDVHTHFVPPEFVADARAGRALDAVAVERSGHEEWLVHPQGYRYPLAPQFFDLDARLRQMDELDIDQSILSLTPTLFFYWLDSREAVDFCRLANDSIAAFAARSARLHALATLPLQRPDEAAAELRRAVTTLGLRGAQIGTTAGEVPLDDRRFDELFATAEALDVPVLLHPYYVGTRPGLSDFYLTNLTGNPLETCIAASRLILSGCLDRHPTLKVVLVHAGGFMPYQIGRLDHGFRVRRETNAAIGMPPSTYLRRFWYDTITHAGAPLGFLVNLVGSDRVMFGSDLPFDMADVRFRQHFTEARLPVETIDAITGTNAAALFGLAPVTAEAS